MDAFHNKCKEKRDMVDCWKTKAEMVYWIVRIFLMLLHTFNHEMKEIFVEDSSKCRSGDIKKAVIEIHFMESNIDWLLACNVLIS